MTFPYVVGIGASSASVPSQTLTIFDEWVLEENLDDGCSLSFTTMTNSVPGVLLKELETDLWLYYNGSVHKRFRVVELEREWDANGAQVTSVSAVCYRRVLKARHTVTPLSFPATSQGDIVWGLIQHAQAQTNGNYGITVGSLGPTVLRDRDYPVGTNIFDAIGDLTTIENGITWDIDENLQLTVSQASLYPTAAQPVEVGTNALSLSKPSGASTFANAVVVTGDTNLTTTVVGTASGLGTDPRGRWERYASYPSEGLQAALVEAADGLLEGSISPSIVYGFRLEAQRYFADSNYQLGDFVTIIEPDIVVPSTTNPTVPLLTVAGIRTSGQIVAKSVTVTTDGDVRVAMRAVSVPQRWDDIASSVTWDSLPVSLAWDNLNNTYIEA